jgi:hypothetical protein
MTAIVIGDDAFEARTDVLYVGDLENESRKLPNAPGDVAYPGLHLFVMPEQVLVVMLNHSRAGAGGHNDVLRAAETIQKMPGNLARFIWKSAIERGLSAARLGSRKIDLETETFEHLSHRDADLREELVDDASDEQRDPGQIQLWRI